MNAQRITLARFAAVAAFTLSCFGLLLYLWLISGGPAPLEPKQYQVHVLLPQAKGLGPHSDVRISGVTVGHVISVEPAQAGRSAAPTSSSTSTRAYVPLRADARAMLRSKSILGEAYVALSLGTADAPPVPDGGTLAAETRSAHGRARPDLRLLRPADAPRAARWLQTEGPPSPRTAAT